MPEVGSVGPSIAGSALSSHLLAAGWTVTGYDVNPAGPAAAADVIVTSRFTRSRWARAAGTRTPPVSTPCCGN